MCMCAHVHDLLEIGALFLGNALKYYMITTLMLDILKEALVASFALVEKSINADK